MNWNYVEWKHPSGFIMDAFGHPVGRWYQLSADVAARVFRAR